ncbi:hypothetical protein AAMO2058_001655200 [Amorphochlora amoebiformis]
MPNRHGKKSSGSTKYGGHKTQTVNPANNTAQIDSKSDLMTRDVHSQRQPAERLQKALLSGFWGGCCLGSR